MSTTVPPAVQLIVGVAGYFMAGTPTAAGAFVPVNPTWRVDSRIGLGTPGRLSATQDTPPTIGQAGGLPKLASASVMINLTVVNLEAVGYTGVRSADGPGCEWSNYLVLAHNP